jgi:hypothetical protein
MNEEEEKSREGKDLYRRPQKNSDSCSIFIYLFIDK